MIMAKSKCSGCPHWKWVKKDKLYDTPGYHRCTNKNVFVEKCQVYSGWGGAKRIDRDEFGTITESCLKEMKTNLPIDLFVTGSENAHRRITTIEELDSYFSGALPYVFTTRWRPVSE